MRGDELAIRARGGDPVVLDEEAGDEGLRGVAGVDARMTEKC